MAKLRYSNGKGVFMLEGKITDEAPQEIKDAGMNTEELQRMLLFSRSIIENAKQQGLKPYECYNAALNTMVLVIQECAVGEQAKTEIISDTTEALFALLGGSELGTKGGA